MIKPSRIAAATRRQKPEYIEVPFIVDPLLGPMLAHRARVPQTGLRTAGRPHDRRGCYVHRMTASLMDNAFRHHVWATLRLLDECLKLSPEQLETAVPGTYGSILDTARHTVGADASYLFVLSGGRVALIDEDAMGLPELRTTMEGYGAEWSSVLADDPSRRRARAAPRRRLRDRRAGEHPARAGAPSRDRSSEPDLHRPDDARPGATLDRRLGLRLGRTAASPRSHGRPDRSGPRKT